ncbi:MAG: hypothetical protein ABIP06_12780 [Pyrinomonadaceae bacterium]
MKKFIITVLCVSTFFIGLGGLVDKVGANFKSDEKAVQIIKLARIAIGGDANIEKVRSMTISANTTNFFENEKTARSESGNLEIALELPNRFSKTLRIGNPENSSEVSKQVEVVVMKKDDGQKVIVKKDANGNVLTEDMVGPKTVIVKDTDGKVLTEDIVGNQKIMVDKDVRVAHGEMRQNELFRTTFALLLSAPEGLDVNYVYVGVGSVDGFSCDIVEAQTGDSAVKLYLDQSSHLPRMMSYQDLKPFMIKFKKEDAKADSDKETKVFVRRTDAPKGETAEFQVKFSDYRSTGDIQLPYKWTQTVGGQTDETIEVSSYEINPLNIADKFKELPQKIMIRTKKEH